VAACAVAASCAVGCEMSTGAAVASFPAAGWGMAVVEPGGTPAAESAVAPVAPEAGIPVSALARCAIAKKPAQSRKMNAAATANFRAPPPAWGRWDADVAAAMSMSRAKGTLSTFILNCKMIFEIFLQFISRTDSVNFLDD
jgi:hypothetical protein